MAMPGEFDLIKHYLLGRSSSVTRRHDGYPRMQIPGSGVLLGAGDDAALLTPSEGKCLSISVDTSVVDVHFPHDAPAYAIGYRALAVSLSDLAAMGARPRWCLMSLSLPDVEESWLKAFSDGFHDLARKQGMTLVGGDVTRGDLSISVTVMGENDPIAVLRRDTAQTEQLIAVTGSLGEAAAGLAAWQTGERDIDTHPLLQAYLLPAPRVVAGQALVGMASAAMDISDGLLADLEHLCQASEVGAIIDVDAVPLSEDARALFGRQRALEMALHGGDDYELLFTLPEAMKDYVSRKLLDLGCPMTVIGRTTTSAGLFASDGTPLTPEGWNHFGH